MERDKASNAHRYQQEDSKLLMARNDNVAGSSVFSIGCAAEPVSDVLVAVHKETRLTMKKLIIGPKLFEKCFQPLGASGYAVQWAASGQWQFVKPEIAMPVILTQYWL